MNTIYPNNACANFNEWAKYVRNCVNEYKQSKIQEVQEIKNKDANE